MPLPLPPPRLAGPVGPPGMAAPPMAAPGMMGGMPPARPMPPMPPPGMMPPGMMAPPPPPSGPPGLPPGGGPTQSPDGLSSLKDLAMMLQQLVGMGLGTPDELSMTFSLPSGHQVEVEIKSATNEGAQ